MRVNPSLLVVSTNCYDVSEIFLFKKRDCRYRANCIMKKVVMLKTLSFKYSLCNESLRSRLPIIVDLKTITKHKTG